MDSFCGPAGKEADFTKVFGIGVDAIIRRWLSRSGSFSSGKLEKR
jgi:hypothetical protein